MSKISKISKNRDKLIDQLIDDKNRIYMKLKRLEKQLDVNKSQVEHWKLRYKLLKGKIKENVNEECNSRIETRRSKTS